MYLQAVPDGCLNILARNFSWPCGCWPQSWPAPKPLKKSTRFRDVKQSHAHSQTFLSQAVPFVSLSSHLLSFIWNIFFALISVKVRNCTCQVWVQEHRVSLCLRWSVKGQEDKRSHPYWFIFSWGLLHCQDLLLLSVCEREDLPFCRLTLWTWVVEVQPTAFPQGRDAAGQWECLSASSLSLTSKSVNL